MQCLVTEENDGRASTAIEQFYREDQKEKVSQVLASVHDLSNVEKLLLYLKLPTGKDRISTSNFDKPSLEWVKSNYTEAVDVYVPKQDVYQHYKAEFEKCGLTPLTSADFGKVIKSAFPNIYHRRLGQRGKSKYCYGGLMKKRGHSAADLEAAIPKEINEENRDTVVLANKLVCEWAEQVLGRQFNDTEDLARYLVSVGAVSGSTVSLFKFLSGSKSLPREKVLESRPQTKTQAMLKGKLHRKEVLKEHKQLHLKQLENQRKLKAELSGPKSAFSPAVNQGYSDSNDVVFKRIPILLSPTQGTVVEKEQSLPKVMIPRYSNSLFRKDIIRKNSKTRQNPFHCSKESCVTGGTEENSVPQTLSDASISTLLSSGDDSGYAHQQLSSSVSLQFLPSIEKIHEVLPPGNQSFLPRDVSISQHKRNGDILGPDQGEERKRRCTTSLGVPNPNAERILMANSNAISNFPYRPYSCPTTSKVATSLHKNDPNFKPGVPKFKNKDKDSEKETCKNVTVPINANITDFQTMFVNELDTDNKTQAAEKFHLVQKPRVIVPTKSLSHSGRSCPNLKHTSEAENDQLTDDTQLTLNSLLSASSISISSNVSIEKNQNELPTLTAPESTTFQVITSSRSSPIKYHTLDDEHFSTLSSRSAFVPVSSQKGLSVSNLNIHQINSGSNYLKSMNGDVRSKSERDLSTDILQDLTSSSLGIQNFKDKQFVVIDKPCTMLESESLSTPAASTAFSQTCSEVQSSPSITYCPQTSCVNNSSSVTQTILHKQSSSNSSTPGSSNPTTPTKRHKNRFTPIRPKLSTPSPQKKDTRAVSTILMERRVRSAHELITGLASSCSSELTLQMPAEFLGLSSPGKNSREIVVTIGPNRNLAGQNSVPQCPENSKETSSSPSNSCSLNAQNMTLQRIPVETETNHIHSKIELSQSLKENSSIKNEGNPLIVKDEKGNMYTLENSSPLQEFKKCFQNSAPSHSSNVLNISDISGKVVGPDTSGHKYLIVPNTSSVSKSTSTLPNSDCSTLTEPPVKAVKTTVPDTLNQAPKDGSLLSENSHQALSLSSNSETISRPISAPVRNMCQSNNLLLTPNPSSSSALLTELSQLASREDRSKCASKLKCNFEKPVPLQSKSNHLPSETTDSSLEPHTAVDRKEQFQIKNTKPDFLQRQILLNESQLSVMSKKRKANEPHEDDKKERKRLNTTKSNFNDTNDVFVSQRSLTESKLDDTRGLENGQGECFRSISRNTNEVISGEQMKSVSNHKSLTVKQVVKLMNSMKSKPDKHKNKSDQPSNKDKVTRELMQTETVDLNSPTVQRAFIETYLKEKDSSVIGSRRMSSLNLESLESDALLDNEPSLFNFSGRDSSDTSRRSKSNADNDPDKHTSYSPVSNNALRSYQMLMNESRKAKFSSFKTVKAILDSKTTTSSILSERSCTSSMLSNKCREKNRTMPTPSCCEVNNESKTEIIQSRSMPSTPISHKETVPKLASSKITSDSDLPLDVAEFITESLPIGKPFEISSNEFLSECSLFSESNYNLNQSLSAGRSLSVPNTTPDLLRLSTTTTRKNDLKIITTEQQYIANNPRKECSKEIQDSCSSVFLSPVGPAKLSRRSSVERSVTQSADRTTALEISEHDDCTGTNSNCNASQNLMSDKVIFESSLASNVDRIDERKSTIEIPTDSNVAILSILGNKTLFDKSSTRTPIDRILTKTPSDINATLTQIDRAMTKTPVDKNINLAYVNRNMSKTPIDRNLTKTPIDRYLAKTPVDRKMTKIPMDRNLSKTPVDRNSSKTPVDRNLMKTPIDRNLTKTPVDGYFIKARQDSSFSKPLVDATSFKTAMESNPFKQESEKSVFAFPNIKSSQSSEIHAKTNENTKQTRDHYLDSFNLVDNSKSVVRRLSQMSPVLTSNSNVSKCDIFGSSEIISRITPISDGGSLSVTPSPIMMSNSGLQNEYYRRDIVSPATIFTPVRSDSAISLSLSSTDSRCLSQSPFYGNNMIPPDPVKLNKKTNANSNEESKRIVFEKDMDHTKELKQNIASSIIDQFLTNQFANLPTPPFSPLSSPQQELSPVSFRSFQNISLSAPSAQSSGTVSANITQQNMTTLNNQLPINATTQMKKDNTFARGKYQSPVPFSSPTSHLISRLSSSPHQNNPHPSPPFTPCSFSPRCPTPSHRSLISPRAATPCADILTAPNRFMPIQSSGLISTSCPTNQKYIQPIRPVVTLASLACTQAKFSNSHIGKGSQPETKQEHIAEQFTLFNNQNPVNGAILKSQNSLSHIEATSLQSIPCYFHDRSTESQVSESSSTAFKDLGNRGGAIYDGLSQDLGFQINKNKLSESKPSGNIANLDENTSSIVLSLSGALGTISSLGINAKNKGEKDQGSTQQNSDHHLSEETNTRVPTFAQAKAYFESFQRDNINSSNPSQNTDGFYCNKTETCKMKFKKSLAENQKSKAKDSVLTSASETGKYPVLSLAQHLMEWERKTQTQNMHANDKPENIVQSKLPKSYSKDAADSMEQLSSVPTEEEHSKVSQMLTIQTSQADFSLSSTSITSLSTLPSASYCGTSPNVDPSRNFRADLSDDDLNQQVEATLDILKTVDSKYFDEDSSSAFSPTQNP